MGRGVGWEKRIQIHKFLDAGINYYYHAKHGNFLQNRAKRNGAIIVPSEEGSPS